MVRRVGARGACRCVIHPDAWRERRVVFPDGAELRLPPPSRGDLEREGVEVGEERSPSLLIDGAVLVTGEVERVTAVRARLARQRGAPRRPAGSPTPGSTTTRRSWCTSAGRGLVVLSGCSHAGAINVLRQAQRLTGEERVHAFVGGMHLSGPAFEPLIPPTLDELAAIGPDWLVPGHCTGWRAQHEIARRMPGGLRADGRRDPPALRRGRCTARGTRLVRDRREMKKQYICNSSRGRET